MFRKVILFGLFEMIQKKKKVRTMSSGPSSAFGSGRVRQRGLSQPTGLVVFYPFYLRVFHLKIAASLWLIYCCLVGFVVGSIVC